jgi:hypothetical protein
MSTTVGSLLGTVARPVGRYRGAGIPGPMPLNSTANSASTRITAVIDVTTDEVVPRPRLSVLGLTFMPK